MSFQEISTILMMINGSTMKNLIAPYFQRYFLDHPVYFFFFHFTVDSATSYFIIFCPKCTLNLRYGELFYKKFVKMFRKIFHILGRDRGLVPYRNVEGGECVGKYFFVKLRKKNMKSLCYFYD